MEKESFSKYFSDKSGSSKENRSPNLQKKALRPSKVYCRSVQPGCSSSSDNLKIKSIAGEPNVPENTTATKGDDGTQKIDNAGANNVEKEVKIVEYAKMKTKPTPHGSDWYDEADDAILMKEYKPKF